MENESTPEVETTAESEPVVTGGSNLPVVITLVSLLLWFGFQTFQLVRQRNNLSFLKASLAGPMQESQKVRAQFEALITKTAELASQGNAGARTVVDELERRGIPIRSVAKPSK